MSASDADSEEPTEMGPTDSDLFPAVFGMEETSEVQDVETRERREALARRVVETPHPTAMLEKFGWVVRLIARFLFAHVLFEKRAVDNLVDAGERGAVVYVMQTRSLLDYLYFNWAFHQHGISIARFSNGYKTTWLRGFFAWIASIFRRDPPEKPEELVQALATNDEPTFLFLEEPKATTSENLEYSQKYLYRLIRAQKAAPHEIFVVPLLLVWERRPDAKHSTIVEEVFGTVQSPGFFRKGLFWFQTIWQSFLKFGQPIAQVSTGISLLQLLREYPGADSADASELLRERLLDHVEQERHVILGPQSDPPQAIWKSVAQSPELLEAVRQVAADEEKPEDEILVRARDQFDEIAAEPNLLTLKVLSAILSQVFYRIYDGFEVDEEGLERVRDAARTNAIVLIPSHKSHVDYLIISYIFYHYGLIAPLIAAGVNLSFWPLGWIFRRAGAFFIRRSFKGEALYPAVFREYLIKIMEEGYPIEFFIEGTRSRTGKLVKPKYGMLDMIVRAFASGRLESVKLVPISVGYERIIEERSHKTEQLGAEKAKESLGGLLRTPRFLASKYGRLYIEFSEPLDVGEYLEKYELARIDKEEVAERSEDIDTLVVRLGHRIIYDINRVTTVTPTALCAMVLLTNEARGLDRHRFLGEVGFLLRFLTEPERDVRLSRTLRDAIVSRSASIRKLESEDARRKDRADASHSTERNLAIESVMGNAAAEVIDEALDLFRESSQVATENSGDTVVYSVPEDARLELSYYRNTIVHHFVPEGLLAAAIASFRAESIPLSELMRETLFLSRLFKYEWIYEERAEFNNVFMRSLRYFETSGWIEILEAGAEEEGAEPDRVVVVGSPLPVEISFFRRQVLSFLEAYSIVAAFAEELEDEGELEQGELLKAILKRARADYERGSIMFWESLSKPTYTNALRLLDDWKIVDRTWDEGRKKTTYRISDISRENGAHHDFRAHLERFTYPDRGEPLPFDDEQDRG